MGESNAVPLGEHRPSHATQVPLLMRQLRPGVRNIRSSYDIARAIGVNQRAIGYIVREARMQGFLVGSKHGDGYFLIETWDELQQTIDHLRTRARGVLVTIEALKESWNQAPGDGRLFP